MRKPIFAVAGMLAFAGATGILSANPASARTFVSVGVGVPAYPVAYRYPGYYPPPVAVGFGGYWGHPYYGWHRPYYGWRRGYWGRPGWHHRW